MGDKLRYEKSDSIARIIINRPEKRNCLDIETLELWHDALLDIQNNREIKALTIQGEGGNFSAGADLSLFLESIRDDDRKTVNRFIDKIHEVTAELEAFRVPTIAAIEGFALAGGLEVLLACDLRIATIDAIIGDQHANYGLVAGGGGTQRLIRQIDTCKANELMYTGRQLSGEEAEEWGIINRAVPEEQFDQEVSKLEKELREKSKEANATTKFLMQKGVQIDKESGLELERQSVVDHYFTDDAIEGFTAFAEDREPNF